MSRKRSMSPLEAQELAVEAFAFIAADSVRIGRFLALTGIDPADLPQQAGSPGFLVGMLEYVLQDESLLLTFCAEARIDPARIALGRHALAMHGS